MVIAYHFVFSAYGFWLPNDPRGSWSDTVRQYELLKFGRATKTSTTASVAKISHDRQRRLAAKEALLYKPVRFTGIQARAIYRGFLVARQIRSYDIRALAILPDHTHLIVMRHDDDVSHIARVLKAKATRQLTDEALHPLTHCPRSDRTLPSPWARNYWCPYIDSDRYLDTAIDYVNNNPERSGLPRQQWREIGDFSMKNECLPTLSSAFQRR